MMSILIKMFIQDEKMEERRKKTFYVRLPF
jgi:hypothetical protein